MSTTTQAGIERLPRGPHRLSREQVANHQRERILAAMIAAAGTKGYGSTTIGDITRRARVSRDTFYEQFANKEAACSQPTTRQRANCWTRWWPREGASELRRGHTRRRARLPEILERAPRRGTRLTLEVLAAGRRPSPIASTLWSFARLYRAVAERAGRNSLGCRPSQTSSLARSSSVQSSSRPSMSARVASARCPTSRATSSTYGSWSSPATTSRAAAADS